MSENTETAPVKANSNNNMLYIIIAIVAVIVIGGGIFLLTQNNNEQSEEEEALSELFGEDFDFNELISEDGEFNADGISDDFLESLLEDEDFGFGAEVDRDDIPSEIPLFESATDFRGDGADSVLYDFDVNYQATDSSQEEIFNFYKEVLEEDGWEITYEYESEYSSNLSATKDDSEMNVTVDSGFQGRNGVYVSYDE